MQQDIEDTPLYTESQGTPAKGKTKGGSSKASDVKATAMKKVAAPKAAGKSPSGKSGGSLKAPKAGKISVPRPKNYVRREPEDLQSQRLFHPPQTEDAIGEHQKDRKRKEVEASLFVATPAYGGLVTIQYMRSILELWPVMASAGIDISWNVAVDSLVTRGRNELAAQFWRSKATHLLFVDADIGFTPGQVLEMLRCDQSFVAGVYPLKTYPLTGVGKKAEPCERRGRFITAEYAGCGFMLLKREVIERMIAAYPETRYTKHHVGGDSVCTEYFALFEVTVHEGTYLSEDYAFCRRWRAIGGTIWLDMEGQLSHTGTHTFVSAGAHRASNGGFMKEATGR